MKAPAPLPDVHPLDGELLTAPGVVLVLDQPGGGGGDVDPGRGGRHGDAGLTIGRQGMQPITDFIDLALQENQPFFLWYAPFLPHTPHNPPERLLKKYREDGRSRFVARYYAMCEWFDETCGQLLDYLDRKKLAEDTLIVFVTDNGWIQNPAGLA